MQKSWIETPILVCRGLCFLALAGMVGSDQDPSIAVFSWCLSLSAYPLLLWLVQAWDSSVRSSADSVFLLDTVFMTLTLFVSLTSL